MKAVALLLAVVSSLGEGIATLVDWFWAVFGHEIAVLQEHDVFPKLLIACFCGALLGLEREFANKPAGLRTNLFICVGSTLFTLASIIAWQTLTGSSPPSDPMRVAAGIVTGVGFLGAGVIFKTEESITGITTAAAIWFVAAVGMMIGIGFPLLGLIISFQAAALLFALGRLERSLLSLPIHSPLNKTKKEKN